MLDMDIIKPRGIQLWPQYKWAVGHLEVMRYYKSDTIIKLILPRLSKYNTLLTTLYINRIEAKILRKKGDWRNKVQRVNQLPEGLSAVYSSLLQQRFKVPDSLGSPYPASHHRKPGIPRQGSASFSKNTNKQTKSFSCINSWGPSNSRGGQLLMVGKVKETTYIIIYTYNKHISSTKDLSVTVLNHFTSVIPIFITILGSFIPILQIS